MINNNESAFYARIISTAYVEQLIRMNGDNIYKHHLGNLEIGSDVLSVFIESYYGSELSEFERICMYSKMLDLNKTKQGCNLKLGSTFYLNREGMNKLNKLMDDFILMNSEKWEVSLNYTCN